MSIELTTKIVFYSSLLLSVHSYVFYPLLIRVIAFFKHGNVSSNHTPLVSVIISAYNEEKVIQKRIENIARQNYDLLKLEVLIGSDRSTDSTNEILLNLESKYPWLRVFIFNERRGKACVVNDLVKFANNEILVFSDANTEFDNNAIKLLVENFDSQLIGGICGRLVLNEIIENKTESVEEKKYWEYETFIKRYEGKCGVIIGANGGIFAIRKSLFSEIPINKAVTDDLFVSLSILAKNFRFIYKPEAFATEEITTNISIEFKRKIRFAATNFQTLKVFKKLLIPKNLLISFAFFSHKVIRWFLPFLLLLNMLANIILINTSFIFSIFFYLQITFYTIGLIGYVLSLFSIRISLFSYVYFFLLSNIALFIGFTKFLRGKQTYIWQSTPR